MYNKRERKEEGMTENRKMMKVKDAQEYLGMSAKSVTNLCNSGSLPGAVKSGKSWLIPFESVQEYGRKKLSDRKANSKLLPLSIGSFSYSELAANSYYIDKTLLIKELIDSRDAVTLFLRPRRFGKTVALDMIKTFFELDHSGDTAALFQNRKIWRCGKQYTRLQGIFPVIHLTFKDVKAGTWNASLNKIKELIGDEAQRLFSGLDKTIFDERDLRKINSFLDETVTDERLESALLDLSRLLKKYYNQKAIILIDEYDTPIQQGYMRGFYNEAIDFMRNFFAAGLKDNPSLEFGVLTGILRVSKENLFSGLNNLEVNTCIDNKYSQYFGFTENEVREMAAYFGHENKMDEITQWYDGYNFGTSKIYNPWSVTKYFNEDCVPDAYWVNTSDNSVIHDVIAGLGAEEQGLLLDVLQGKPVQTLLQMDTIYPNLNDGSNAVLSFLLLAGYLTVADDVRSEPVGKIGKLVIPNTEVQRVYSNEIVNWISNDVQIPAARRLQNALFAEKPDLIKKILEEFLLSCVSSFDMRYESFYHGLVLGMTSIMQSRYQIDSNREAGEGRYDVQLFPLKKSMPGFIIEFKAEKDNASDLKAIAEEAIRQINRKKYETEMRKRGVGKIIKYGIAFRGKSAEAAVED